MYKRSINLLKTVEKKSFFLIGPRQTGKSTLVKGLFPDALYINLLHADTFRSLSARPEELRGRVRSLKEKSRRIIIIDEIQKLPVLLDEVHDLIESDKSLRFILTGSSARKLRNTGTNLLGGRARIVYLHPLTSQEYPDDILRMVQWGGLPSILQTEDPKDDLKDYIGVYLHEEVQAEGLVRGIENFSRFLNIAAISNGEQINFSNIASDAELSAKTVREYFSILQDTLVGTLLPGFTETSRRRAMTSAKFFFFDVGVANALLGRWNIEQGTPEFGRAMEHLVWRELQTYIDYHQLDVKIHYWRSLSKLEVDFIITDHLGKKPLCAIEVKAKRALSKKDLNGITAFREDFKDVASYIVNLSTAPQTFDDGTKALPLGKFLDDLWQGRIVELAP